MSATARGAAAEGSLARFTRRVDIREDVGARSDLRAHGGPHHAGNDGEKPEVDAELIHFAVDEERKEDHENRLERLRRRAPGGASARSDVRRRARARAPPREPTFTMCMNETAPALIAMTVAMCPTEWSIEMTVIFL